MDNINIEGTSKSPSVLSDSAQGLIEIKGRSNIENSMLFYKPIIDWIELYGQAPSEMTTINIQLEHFNTSSSKCILDLLKKAEIIHKAQKQVIVNWYYEMNDEDMMEAGEVYRTMTTIPIKLVEY
jgi:hypothetical protein